MKKSLFFSFLFLSFGILAQTSTGTALKKSFESKRNEGVFFLDSLPEVEAGTSNNPAIEVSNEWKYQNGDDMKWAEPNFDDGSWKFLSPKLDFLKMTSLGQSFNKIAWFRLHIIVDTSLVNKTIALMITQSGASEIYLDGILIHKLGVIDQKNTANESRYDPQEIPLDIRFENTRTHVLAVRYANAIALDNYRKGLAALGGFDLKFASLKEAGLYKNSSSNILTAIFVFYFAFFLALSFLHFVFFIFYRRNKSNLYYSIFAGSFGTFFLSIVINNCFTTPDFNILVTHVASLLSDIYISALLAMLYSIFYKKLPKVFWIWMILFVLDFVTSIFFNEVKQLGYLLYFIFFVESLRVIIAAIYKKQEGSWIIGTGVIVTVVFFGLFIVISILGMQTNFGASGWAGLLVGLLAIYATLSIPVSMTIYLAKDFSRTSKNLSKKLIEVEELSAKSIEQEKEKQKILEAQKEILEIQVEERTSEIRAQKYLIEEKNKDITDSINYAKTIQEAILPPKEIKYKIFPNAFVLFIPKDIVSGDFYWFTEKDGKKIIAACDCTGHGVPGALMSMVGNNILHQIVNEKGICNPGAILDYLNKEIQKALKQDGKSESNDGMDISMLCFTSESEVLFAGAQRPLWIIRAGELIEIKGSKHSIGGNQSDDEKIFEEHTISLQKNDSLYITSDGYADQFSAQGKKMMTKQFKETLLGIVHLSMEEQEKYLATFINDWKGDYEQTDDILVIGIKK